LPSDTEWYEAELTVDDLINIRAFPRAQWRKPARGSFSITEIVEGVRGHHDVIDEQSLIKINDISLRLSKGTACLGTLILIGLNESEPLTVLDGNHRLVAALLASPKELNKLRFMCGLSPRMMECCWYNTNLATLFRYGKNMLMNFVRKPKAELVRLLQDIS
jgi:hypothetical protein